MTHLQSALYAAMQEKGYSDGFCVVALHLLGGNNAALREMLLFITDRKVSEKRATEELGRICREFGITPKS